MEEDKELELSLGLACGLTTSASNDKSGNPADDDDRTDGDERTSKILNDFRNFLNAGVSQSFEVTDPVTPQEIFFHHIQPTASGENVSSKGEGASENKRKSSFDETKNPKKQETESRTSGLQNKENNSHISITTDEGSTGDNEDVAESEAEGSTSRMVSHNDDGSRTPVGSACSFQAPKEANELANVGASSFPIQTKNTSSVPYSITIKESVPASVLSTSMYPLPHGASTKSVPMTFAHSSVQIPDKGNSWGISRPSSLHSPYSSRTTPTSVSVPVTNPTSSGTALPDVGPQKQVDEEGFVSRAESDTVHLGAPPNSFPSEYPAIRPGIAAEVKFGGSGHFPNLPWVSTTGPGPNGKTISGVTYKFNATQIKVVCACHGVHLSPDEFVRHATQDQPSGLTSLTTPGLASLQSTNTPATSA